ncbi:MAG: OPT family oligopeptide transporter [Gemmatales bacterium]|nr:OPT/YSL family transporter [Gemmatales bacterium]MDW7993629.1 OPT family oligopeptide transporter [Gemmatales bacterium]
MAIHELTQEQIRTWTLEQKDRWWLENVFRGDMPQLTLRAALTGMLLGGLLSLTNLYVGAKTGWTLGVGMTSVILAFAAFRILARLGLARELTILENNAMQSVATAAGYMTAPLISSLAAYMMVQQRILPLWQVVLWMVALALLGVLFAFPFKRRFINDEQQPFPEGRAAGIVMDALHHGQAEQGVVKAKLLTGCAALAACVRLLQNEKVVHLLGLPWRVPESLWEWFYRRTADIPQWFGNRLDRLTVGLELDLAMFGAGGLIGIRVTTSMLLGAFVNFVILAPWLIQRGDITPGPSGVIGFREITLWSLWSGVAMMTVASLLAFFSKPEIIWGPMRRLLVRQDVGARDVLAHIELPIQLSLVGVPIIGTLICLMGWAFFDISPLYSAVAIVLTFFFCLIAINSTGLTSITPIGALAKLTQLTFAILAPGDKGVNLMTAGITGEVASNSANLLMDIKPGYMLGAKPRQQAFGHVLGAIAGALVATPVFYLVFLHSGQERLNWSQALWPEPNVQEVHFGSHPMPSATVWRAVADILAEGIDSLPVSARWAVLVALVAGLGLEWLRLRDKSPLSPIGFALGFVIPFYTCAIMFLGAFVFWLAERLRRPENWCDRWLVQNQEPICAGLIAGGSLMGIFLNILDIFLP